MTNNNDSKAIPDSYRGREQSFVKHIFLENYIERVAYNLLSVCDDFVYVDGFSGPWQSAEEGYEDTSFAIAIKKLRAVKNTYAKHGKLRTVRCLFIEKDKKAFSRLQDATRDITDIQITILNGEFEDNIDNVVAFIGRSFSFVFIDPKGWKGFSLTKISSLLKKRGEVIINFMFDFINRFIQDPRPEIAASFDPVFGDDGWFVDFSKLVESGADREDAILKVYLDRLKKVSGFTHVTSTRIKHPEKERTYFHLVYGTNHPKGIVEFRKAEEKAARIQEQIRVGRKIDQKTDVTGMADLFGATEIDANTRDFQSEQAKNISLAKKKLVKVLNSKSVHRFDVLQGQILEVPLVTAKDLNSWIMKLKNLGSIHIPAMTSRERSAKRDHLIQVQEKISFSSF